MMEEFGDGDGEYMFWVPNYLLERARVHDFPAASSGQTTCTRCGFSLSMTTVYDVPPLCLVV